MASQLAGGNDWLTSQAELSELSCQSELLALLQPCCARTPTVTYLGVSPPVRSGAANPWAHDRSWARSVYDASNTSLQALRELDSPGESFLTAGARGAPPVPVPLPGAPAALAAGCGRGGGDVCGLGFDDEYGGCSGGSDDDKERLSDAGSESAASGPPAPRAMLATTAGGGAARAPPAPAPLRASFAPPPAAPLGHLVVRAPGGRGAGEPPPGARSSGAAVAAPAPKPHVLEPFACHTCYYV